MFYSLEAITTCYELGGSKFETRWGLDFPYPFTPALWTSQPPAKVAKCLSQFKEEVSHTFTPHLCLHGVLPAVCLYFFFVHINQLTITSYTKANIIYRCNWHVLKQTCCIVSSISGRYAKNLKQNLPSWTYCSSRIVEPQFEKENPVSYCLAKSVATTLPLDT